MLITSQKMSLKQTLMPNTKHERLNSLHNSESSKGQIDQHKFFLDRKSVLAYFVQQSGKSSGRTSNYT